MRDLQLFTLGFLAAVSAVIMLRLAGIEDTKIKLPDYGYAEPSYTIERMTDGWCAGRVIRRDLTYEATYCAGEFGRVPINIPHTDSPEWDSVFEAMMNEVDSLAGVRR